MCFNINPPLATFNTEQLNKNSNRFLFVCVACVFFFVFVFCSKQQQLFQITFFFLLLNRMLMMRIMLLLWRLLLVNYLHLASIFSFNALKKKRKTKLKTAIDIYFFLRFISSTLLYINFDFSPTNKNSFEQQQQQKNFLVRKAYLK